MEMYITDEGTEMKYEFIVDYYITTVNDKPKEHSIGMVATKRAVPKTTP